MKSALLPALKLSGGNSTSEPNFAEPYYVVLFRSSAGSGPFPPVVDPMTYSAEKATLPYGLDRGVAAALPALWYCLHLPRTRFDFSNIQAKAMKAFQQLNLPHHIVLMPVPWPEPLPQLRPAGWPAIILWTKDLKSEANQLASLLPSVVDVVDAATLDVSTLQHHWDLLYEALQVHRPRYAYPSVLSGASQRGLLLPHLFVARQLRGGRDEEIHQPDLTKAAVMQDSTHFQVVLSATARLEREGTTYAEAEKIFPQTISEERQSYRCPVSLLLPGTSPSSATRRILKTWRTQGVDVSANVELESTALEFLVAHRAAARLGVSITAASVSDQAFEKLASLERMFGTGRTSPRKVRSHLARLSNAVGTGLTFEEKDALLHASSITCFSDFPVGLVTIPPDTSPLCCRSPIAYRPLTPLTRALQFETIPDPQIYLRDKVAIVCLECIPRDDPVGRLSRLGWKQAVANFPASSNAIFDYVEVNSVEEIRQALRAKEYDIAIISAHGFYDRKANRTGIRIGMQDKILEEELGSVPPLVCLSSCQVAPRGTGSVNISDLLFRQGAIAVLGTLAPINVRRNAHLMVRFFYYIAETLAARTAFRAIDEIWQFTVASNAVFDIAFGAQQAEELIFRERNGSFGLEDFMYDRSVGRLRPGHIYADTEAVLQEMADERGHGAAFEAWLKNQGYIPESIFYVFLGWPERLLVHDSQLEEARSRYDPQ